MLPEDLLFSLAPLDPCLAGEDWLADLPELGGHSAVLASAARSSYAPSAALPVPTATQPRPIHGSRSCTMDDAGSLESTQTLLGSEDVEPPSHPYLLSGAPAYGQPSYLQPSCGQPSCGSSPQYTYAPSAYLARPQPPMAQHYAYAPPQAAAYQQYGLHEFDSYLIPASGGAIYLPDDDEVSYGAVASGGAFGGRMSALAAPYAHHAAHHAQHPHHASAPAAVSWVPPPRAAAVDSLAHHIHPAAPQACASPQQSYYDMEVSEHGTDATEDSDATMHAMNSPCKSPSSIHLDCPIDSAAVALGSRRPPRRAAPSTKSAAAQVGLRLVIKQQQTRAGQRASAAARLAAGGRQPRRAAALRRRHCASEDSDDEEEEEQQSHEEEAAYESAEEDEEVSLPPPRPSAPTATAAALQNCGKKKHNPWSQEETEALIEGVRLVGVGKWAEIKKLPLPSVAGLLTNRSAVDLKDKWRNLSRVARLPKSALKSRLAKGGSDTPLELVLAVKELLDSSRADHRDWR